jgi:hypothetical protein
MLVPAPKYRAAYTTSPAVASVPATAGSLVTPDMLEEREPLRVNGLSNDLLRKESCNAGCRSWRSPCPVCPV